MNFLSLATLRHGSPLFAGKTRWAPLPALGAAILIFGAALLVGHGLVVTLKTMAGQLSGGATLGPATITVCYLVGMQAAMVVLTLTAAGFGGMDVAGVLSLGPCAKGRRGYLEALAGVIALSAGWNAFAYATGLSDLVSDLKPFIGLLRAPVWPLAILAVSIGAPASEELLFRGFLLPALARTRLRYRGGALLSTALWTALHAGYSAAGLIEVMLVGLYFCWLLWRTGSLRVTLVCHAVYNTLVMLGMLAWLHLR